NQCDTRVTEDGKNGETEDREICNRTQRSQRNARHSRIRTTQNSRAARNDRAADTLTSNVFDREVKSVGKSDQCQQCGDDVKLLHQPLLPQLVLNHNAQFFSWKILEWHLASV